MVVVTVAALQHYIDSHGAEVPIGLHYMMDFYILGMELPSALTLVDGGCSNNQHWFFFIVGYDVDASADYIVLLS